MKNIILSSDGEKVVYTVPDVVADNLADYCLEFVEEWLWSSPDAAKHITKDGVSYNEADFIEYLNQWIFPNEKSFLRENLGFEGPIPKKYRHCPKFNF